MKLRYSSRIWGCAESWEEEPRSAYGRYIFPHKDPEETAKKAIECTVDYFKEIGMPTSLGELGIGQQDEAALRALSMNATKDDSVELSFIRKLKAEDVYQIFVMANR